MTTSVINSDDGLVSGSAGLKTTGGNDGVLQLQSNGTATVTVTAAGNVGVGTSSPATKLHVEQSTTGDAVKIARGGNYFVIGGSGSGTQYVKGYEGTVAFGNAYTGNTTFLTGDTERMRIDSSGNVGIGTSSPAFPLDVAGAIRGNSWIGRGNTSAPTADAFIFRPADNTLGLGTGNTERARFTSDGYLRMASGSGGIQFGGDTAAANALDDYEEGTWTPVPTASGVTFSTNVDGSYTKIGNTVYISGWLDNSSAPTGTLSNEMTIAGLPFTSSSGIGYGCSVSIGFFVTLDWPASALQLGGRVTASSTQIVLQWAQDDAGALDFLASHFDGGDSRIAFAGFYFV